MSQPVWLVERYRLPSFLSSGSEDCNISSEEDDEETNTQELICLGLITRFCASLLEYNRPCIFHSGLGI